MVGRAEIRTRPTGRLIGIVAMIDLAFGDYALSINPGVGGSLSAFRWRGQDVMRPAEGASVLDSSCFPLVPFSNRIAGSRFEFGGQDILLEPNHPSAPNEPVLHGYGWTSGWSVLEASSHRALIGFCYPGGDWPWPFTANAAYELDETGLKASLSVTNEGDSPMPAGLGFHPYFPRTSQTAYRGYHRGEWQVDDACLPRALSMCEKPCDWWDGKPVGTRLVDTVYAGREGPLQIHWPERDIAAVISPDNDLGCTTIYVPAGENFFCVEPVSHATDAIHGQAGQPPMHVLMPGEEWTVSMSIEVRSLT